MKKFIKFGKSLIARVFTKTQNQNNTKPNKQVCCQERNDHGYPCICSESQDKKK